MLNQKYGKTPQIIPFVHRVWNHYFHHPFWGTMIFGNNHINYINYMDIWIYVLYTVFHVFFVDRFLRGDFCIFYIFCWDLNCESFHRLVCMFSLRTLLEVKLETHGLPPVRWKNVDLWESRRGNEFLLLGLVKAEGKHTSWLLAKELKRMLCLV